MGRCYRHLSLSERVRIQMGVSEGLTAAVIARQLGRHRSSIGRELHRNGWVAQSPPRGRPPAGVQGYDCERAHHRAARLSGQPRLAKRLLPGNALWQRVIGCLAAGLSPQQASGTLRRMHPPVRISHPSIYTALYAMPRGQLRQSVLALLRRGGKRPKPTGDRRGLMVGMTSIEERPIEVDERLVPGHWEGDLIKGAGNRSQVGTLVERTSLFTLLVRVPQATAADTANAFIGVLKCPSLDLI